MTTVAQEAGHEKCLLDEGTNKGFSKMWSGVLSHCADGSVSIDHPASLNYN